MLDAAGQAQSTIWRLGTIGFAYDDWAGVVYPAGVSPRRRLPLYAQQFGTVELDTTYHAIPRPEIVRRWEEAVPDDFRFSLKAPRDVTHEGSPTFPASRDAMARFLDVARLLGPKLGVVLLQFPARFRHAGSTRLDLELFLRSLPSDLTYAVELRDASWWARDTVEMFRGLSARGGIRITCVGADMPTEAVAGVSPDDEAAGGGACRPAPMFLVGDLLYVRWVGIHNQYPSNDRERVDPTARLAWWAERLKPFLTGASPVREVYGYFGNTYSGHAPATLRRFAQLAGLPYTPEDAAPVRQQGQLF